MLIAIILIIAVAAGIYIFMQQAQFGAAAKGNRLERIQSSPNFKKGQFQNLSHTPQLAEDTNMARVMRQFIFERDKRNKPTGSIPSVRTDLKRLPASENVLVWFGHSSYFIQLDGKKILVDPVFSGHASPVSFTTRSYNGANTYTVDDMPEIDYLFITHDHYDHMDYDTIVKLRTKVKQVITGLGVGAHLERWGYAAKAIIENDWYEEVNLGDGFTVTATPGRHFSGRNFKRNTTLWCSFVLQTPSMKLFFGGDSGYDTHFAHIGSTYGPFDIAILEDGQYNENWKYIHMMPEETVQAAIDLKAKKLLPIHWGKFSLALHAWDEPIKRIVKEAEVKHLPLLHPMPGEAMQLGSTKAGNRWWEQGKN